MMFFSRNRTKVDHCGPDPASDCRARIRPEHVNAATNAGGVNPRFA
jgi:hypothetical protein